MERLARISTRACPARAVAEPLPDDLDLLTAQDRHLRREHGRGGRRRARRRADRHTHRRRRRASPVAARFEAELAQLDDLEERGAFLAGPRPPVRPGCRASPRAAFRRSACSRSSPSGPRRPGPGRCAGACAVEAAGKIHSDIARGFIRAEVIG